MTPAFNSWAEFFAMGGYAFYVWLAVVVALLSLFGLWAHTLWMKQRLLKSIRRQRRRDQRVRQAQQRERK